LIDQLGFNGTFSVIRLHRALENYSLIDNCTDISVLQLLIKHQ